MVSYETIRSEARRAMSSGAFIKTPELDLGEPGPAAQALDQRAPP